MSADFGFPRSAGQIAHDAAVALSEGTRQGEIAAADAAYGGVDPAQYPTYAAAVRAADIAHLQRVNASAAANGISVLMSLG